LRILCCLTLLFVVCLHQPAAAEVALQNGVPYGTSLSAMQYGSNLYIDVPANAVSLTVTITNGSGDLDLYVKYGSSVQGTTIAELDADTDFLSDGPTANETVLITTSSNPPLRAGKWYVSALNLNSVATSFTLTAVYQTSGGTVDQGTKHTVSFTVSPEVVLPGMNVNWKYEIQPGTMAGNVDVIAAVFRPDGALQFYGPNGFTTTPTPLRTNVALQGPLTDYVLVNQRFSSGDLEGVYTYFVYLARAGNMEYDNQNWVSVPAGGVAHVARLSSSQKALIHDMGYPQMFQKTFSDDPAGIRIDEVWGYAKYGKVYSFINGALLKEETLSSSDINTLPGSIHPEDYQFDTTYQNVIDRHGQPLKIDEEAIAAGAFKNAIYNGVVFQFLDNRLVSVSSFK